MISSRPVVDDVVRKPVHVREIIARVKAIRRRASGAPDYTDVGEMRVYFDGRDPGDQGRGAAASASRAPHPRISRSATAAAESTKPRSSIPSMASSARTSTRTSSRATSASCVSGCVPGSATIRSIQSATSATGSCLMVRPRSGPNCGTIQLHARCGCSTGEGRAIRREPVS